MDTKDKEKRMVSRSKAGIALRLFGSYFNILPDKEDEQATIESISAGVRFRGANLWVLIFAIFIASLGLNVNSTAVIIGAMLISPLMGPILGLGLSLGIRDYILLRRSLKNYAVSTIISVVTATLYFAITPFEGEQSELLARTSPTLYDVLIAFFGGMAGIVAASTKGKGNVIPGVAIATALMPPLCTAGYGLASANWSYFLGAFYLFFINTVFIGLATFLGVKFLRFKPVPTIAKGYHHIGRFIAIGVLLSLIPASIMTYRIIKDAFFKENVTKYVKSELSQSGTEILTHDVDPEKHVIQVVAVGREIKPDAVRRACERMSNYSLEGYTLKVVQGEQSDSVMRLSDRLDAVMSSHDKSVELMQAQADQMSKLKQELEHHNRFANLSNQLGKELQLLFPEVASIYLADAEEMKFDSVQTNARHTMAVVRLRHKEEAEKFNSQHLADWLKTRVEEDSVVLVVAP